MRDGAHARFWAGLGAGRRRQLEGSPGWQARLDTALAEPALVWDAEWLARDDFAAEIAQRCDADGDREPARADAAAAVAALDDWWEHLRAADLYLACACARGVAPAIRCFERLFGEEIARAARRFERQGLAADDLIQLLRTKLFAAPAGEAAAPSGRPKIASYTGQGFLQNWVRVTTTRTFIDCCRWQADAHEVPIAADLLATLPEAGADPELQLLKREHAAHFKASFAEAVAALDAGARLILRQHLVERLTVDQIGALYHLHRATAARRVARARDELIAGVRDRLARRLGLAPDRLAAALTLMASRLEASVERVLR